MRKSTCKIGIIVQARLGSTRLPGKVLLDVQGYPVLYHVLNRVSQVENVEVIVATSTSIGDNPIECFCKDHGVQCFRGSELNVLERYYQAAKHYGFDTIVRITSDCPFIDPHIISSIIEHYKKTDCDMVTNGGADLKNRTFPRGMDVSVFSFDVLEEAFLNATKKSQLEHVTPYMYEHSKVEFFKQDIDQSHYRLTLDTFEDLELTRKIYSLLHKDGELFYLDDIISLLERNPEMVLINQFVKQKEV